MVPKGFLFWALFGPLFLAKFSMRAAMTPSDNSGKLMTKRLRGADGTTLVLNYAKHDAQAIRAFVESFRIKGDRKVSLSLIARRSLGLYLARMGSASHSRPDVFEGEIAELERMCTPVAQPAKRTA